MKAGSWLALAVIGLLILSAGPVGGQAGKKPIEKLERIGPFGQMTHTEELKAGKETRVLAGSYQVPRGNEVRQGVYVFDAHGNCLACGKTGIIFKTDIGCRKIISHYFA